MRIWTDTLILILPADAPVIFAAACRGKKRGEINNDYSKQINKIYNLYVDSFEQVTALEGLNSVSAKGNDSVSLMHIFLAAAGATLRKWPKFQIWFRQKKEISWVFVSSKNSTKLQQLIWIFLKRKRKKACKDCVVQSVKKEREVPFIKTTLRQFYAITKG